MFNIVLDFPFSGSIAQMIPTSSIYQVYIRKKFCSFRNISSLSFSQDDHQTASL